MTVLTMRRIRDHFIVTGSDIEPLTFKTRYEARVWCREHHPGSPRRPPERRAVEGWERPIERRAAKRTAPVDCHLIDRQPKRIS